MLLIFISIIEFVSMIVAEMQKKKVDSVYGDLMYVDFENVYC